MIRAKRYFWSWFPISFECSWTDPCFTLIHCYQRLFQRKCCPPADSFGSALPSKSHPYHSLYFQCRHVLRGNWDIFVKQKRGRALNILKFPYSLGFSSQILGSFTSFIHIRSDFCSKKRWVSVRPDSICSQLRIIDQLIWILSDLAPTRVNRMDRGNRPQERRWRKWWAKI